MATRRKKKVDKEMALTVVVFAIVLALLIPMVLALVPARIHSDFSYVQYLPDAVVDTTASAEFALGGAYLNTAYAARDLSAAAYSGIATAYVGGLESLHGVQMRAYTMMGDSMADGASEVGGAYGALLNWYGKNNTVIEQRLSQPTP